MGSKLLNLSGRRLARAAILRTMQATINVSSVATVDESVHHWLSREDLHARIFELLAQENIPLDKDRSHVPPN